MSEQQTLRRLRTYLLALAAVLFTGTVAELLLAGHTEDAIQWLPFVLCGLGLLCTGILWVRPSRRSILATRLLMLVVAGGSLLGVAEHFLGNRGFALETRPNAGAAQLFREALTGGVPLLAPGILAVAAAVAIAATYASVDGGGSGPIRDSEEEAAPVGGDDRRNVVRSPALADRHAVRHERAAPKKSSHVHQ